MQKKKKIQLFSNIYIENNIIIKETYNMAYDNIKMFSFKAADDSFLNDKIHLLKDYVTKENSIYFLINNKNKNFYVGQTRNFINRVQDHKNKKNFNVLIIIYSNKWGASELDYFETLYINLLQEKNNTDWESKNQKQESVPKIPEYAISIVEKHEELISMLFLDKGIILHQKDKIDFVGELNKTQAIKQIEQIDNKNEIIVCYKNARGIYHPSNPTSEQLTLLRGSKLIYNKQFIKNIGQRPDIKRYYDFFKKYENILKQLNDNEFELLEEINVSPSMGAVVAHGYFSMNGANCWKTEDGKTINDLKKGN